MKMFKRIAALALSAVMAAGMLVTPAWADETDNVAAATNEQGSIQITNAVPGATYKAYKLLDVELVEVDGENMYVYTIDDDSAWDDFFKVGEGSTYFEVEGTSAKWQDGQKRDDETVQVFAKAAKTYAADNAIEANGSVDFTGASEMAGGAASAGIAVIENLDPGYYLITSSSGSLCMTCTLLSLQTQTVDDKKVLATVKKEVWEDRYGDADSHYLDENVGWGSTNDAEIGEIVTYRVTIIAGGNTDNYTLLDFMYPGLELIDDSFMVYKNGQTLGLPDNNENYGIYINEGWNATDEMVEYNKNNILNQAGTSMLNDEYGITTYAGDDAAGLATSEKPSQQQGQSFTDCAFAVRFFDDKVDLVEGDKLVVIYKAVLGENALISPLGNDNIAVLGYGYGNMSISDFNVRHILQQAGQSMLAQANQNNQNILGLLQSDDIPVGDDDEFTVYSDGDDDYGGNDSDGDNNGTDDSGNLSDEKLSSGYKINRANVVSGYQGFTLPSITTTYTYQMNLIKVDGQNNVLPDAKFQLQDADGKVVSLVAYTAPTTNWANWTTGGNLIGDGELSLIQSDDILVETNWGDVKPVAYRIAQAGDRDAVTDIPVGIAVIVGLNHGDYKLVETEAPAGGYNKLKDPIALSVVSDPLNEKETRELKGTAKLKIGDTVTSLTMSENALIGGNDGLIYDAKEGGLGVVNNIGGELPHTGGIGTTIFYVVGGLLVVGAGILLVVKKRMNDQ